MTQQDSAFYTDNEGTQVVWDADPEKRFYVVRNGEMRIHARHNAEDNHHEVIRYTDQLEDFGITNDKELEEWTSKGEDFFDWIHNSWFEVYDTEDTDYFSEPYHTLDDAIGQAQTLRAELGN